MAYKLIAVLGLIATVNAGLLGQVYEAPIAAAQYVHSAPAIVQHTAAVPVAHTKVLTKEVDEYDPHPKYSYSYDIQDHLTGDSKNQHETRDGDHVEGQYSLIDADGFQRIVHYTSDPIHGFNAIVERHPLAVHQKIVKEVIPTTTVIKAH